MTAVTTTITTTTTQPPPSHNIVKVKNTQHTLTYMVLIVIDYIMRNVVKAKTEELPGV
jgi:hypothetical protein